MRRMMIGAVLAVLTAGPAFGQGVSKPTPIDRSQVAYLLGQLGSDDYRAREKAGKSLLTLGDRVIPVLKTALKTTDDPEVSRRLQVIVRKLDEDRLGQPRRVTLSATRKLARDILAEVGKQAGYTLVFGGGGDDKARYSFEFKDTPFWEALDKVCDATGMVSSTQDDEGAIGVSFGDTFNPYVSYHGPFKVLATNINSGRNIQLAGLNRRQPNGHQPEFLNLNLSVLSEPKAPLVGVGAVAVTKAVDDRGTSLIPPADFGSDLATISLYTPAVGFKSFTQGTAVALTRGDRAATAIKEVRGKVSVAVLADTRPELVIDDLLKAKKRRFAGGSVEIEVTAVDYQNDVLALELTIKRRAGDPNDYSWLTTVIQRMEVHDGDGRRYQFAGLNNQNMGPGAITLSGQFTHPEGKKLGKPARLQVVEWVTVTKEVEFTFKDIPLP